MSDEKEKQAAPVYPTPVTAPAPVPAPVYPTPVTAPVPPVYPTPVTAPGYPTPVPPAKAETPYYPTTAPPPVPATPYGYPTTAPLSPASATTTTNGKVYQDQLLAPCAAGYHDPRTKFGTCGIITAICCFPIGLLCLCADKETRCRRCGALLP